MDIHERIPDGEKYLSLPKERIATVKFGDVCITSYTNPCRGDTLRISIVLELDACGSFGIHTISEIDDKEVIRFLGGTAFVDDILEIIDHWDLNRIVDAYKEGCRLVNTEFSSNQMEILKKEAEKPPFNIKK